MRTIQITNCHAIGTGYYTCGMTDISAQAEDQKQTLGVNFYAGFSL